jgi:hypothetical protein
MAKRKIKKALKGLAKVAIPAAALAAFMGGRQGKTFTNADARKLMTSNAAMRGLPRGGATVPMNSRMLADELMQLNEGTDFGLGPLDMKKGGRVKKTKFSKKKKQQANRSKKK